VWFSHDWPIEYPQRSLQKLHSPEFVDQKKVVIARDTSSAISLSTDDAAAQFTITPV
jgi:hypothetical protein